MSGKGVITEKAYSFEFVDRLPETAVKIAKGGAVPEAVEIAQRLISEKNVAKAPDNKEIRGQLRAIGRVLKSKHHNLVKYADAGFLYIKAEPMSPKELADYKKKHPDKA